MYHSPNKVLHNLTSCFWPLRIVFLQHKHSSLTFPHLNTTFPLGHERRIVEDLVALVVGTVGVQLLWDKTQIKSGNTSKIENFSAGLNISFEGFGNRRAQASDKECVCVRACVVNLDVRCAWGASHPQLLVHSYLSSERGARLK